MSRHHPLFDHLVRCRLGIPNRRRPRQRIWRVSRQARPSSADRTQSPVAVSRKREYFNELPETFDNFAPKPLKTGVWRPLTKLQKPAIGGLLPMVEGQFLRRRTARLATQCRSRRSPDQFPANREFYREILRFWGSASQFQSKRSLYRSHFSNNSLRKLTGKIFQRTGSLFVGTGNLLFFGREGSKRPFLAHFSWDS
jgi:hypothetical protein